jgi:tetratricopeptide (TPR) repeat protein
MFVVTFYSYKGGVGRTSALVNVAMRLARRGKRVFVIDFDLEAPGIDSFGLINPSRPAPGLVEYIAAFMQTGRAPNVEDYVQRSSLPNANGKLFFMSGGMKDDAYKAALGQLDWKVLYRERKGYFLIENLRAAILEMFKPDYLLIDARTGLTDVSGICTQQLPDLVVLLFSLNEQNVLGVGSVLQSIKRNRLNRSIATMLVASPVPDLPEWNEARTMRFESARIAMGSPADAVLPYDASLAFKESIIESSSQSTISSNLGKAYDSLMMRIIAANPSDVLTLLGQAIRLKNEGHLEAAEANYRTIADTVPDSVETWMEFGKFERSRGKTARAGECFEKAYVIEPDDCEVLAQLTSTYAYIDKAKCERYYREFLGHVCEAHQIASVSTVLRRVGLANLALEGFLRLAELNDKDPVVFVDLGETRMQLRHFREAAEVYRRALQLDPNNLVSVYNLAAALQQLDDPHANEYFAKAVSIFEQTKQPLNKVTLVNHLESMSRAYMALGKTKQAVQLMESALTNAKECPPHTHFFSSSKYLYISLDKFIAEVSPRLQLAKKMLSESVDTSGKVN